MVVIYYTGSGDLVKRLSCQFEERLELVLE
jgi:hypothetical protein